jgi:hypothetical protein
VAALLAKIRAKVALELVRNARRQLFFSYLWNREHRLQACVPCRWPNATEMCALYAVGAEAPLAGPGLDSSAGGDVVPELGGRAAAAAAAFFFAAASAASANFASTSAASTG